MLEVELKLATEGGRVPKNTEGRGITTRVFAGGPRINGSRVRGNKVGSYFETHEGYS